MAEASAKTPQLHRWLVRIEQGDLSAREELLQSVGHRLERLAHKMLARFPKVRRWADSDDVLQNSLLRLLRALEQVRPDSMRAFYGLAAEQMRRELLDLARKFALATRVGVGQPRLTLSDSQLPTPKTMAAEDDPAELEVWERFHEAVLQLPVEEREVVSLIFYHGWSQAKIAELFQVDERTVRRRWRSACLQLQTQLKGRFPGGTSDVSSSSQAAPQ